MKLSQIFASAVISAFSFSAFGMNLQLGQSIQIESQNEIGVKSGQIDASGYYKVAGARLIENDTVVEIDLEQFFTPVDKVMQKGLLNQPRNVTIVVENKPTLSDVPGIKLFKNK